MRFLKVLFTIIFVLLGGLVGYQFSHLLNQADFFAQSTDASIINDFILSAIGAIVGFLVYPYIFRWFIRWMEDLSQGMQKLSPFEILWGGGGLLFGLAVSSLITYTLVNPVLSFFALASESAGIIKTLFIVCSTLFFTTLTVLLTVRLPWPRKGLDHTSLRPKVLDTSAIIDGRIYDLFQAGFSEAEVVIPHFVLEELQRIADSPDTLKRNRGRRGLDLLNKMKQSKSLRLQFYDREVPGEAVDTKLVNLTKKLEGTLITSDYNLNKVAQVQGVSVLNINELANALKTVVLPGEEINVQISREGKEVNQGVAYLDDGTMVIVENGRKLIGETVPVEVSSVLQTAAGRMIFSHPKSK